jgi:hypothetical protein
MKDLLFDLRIMYNRVSFSVYDMFQRLFTKSSGCFCVICLREVPKDIFEQRNGCCADHTPDQPTEY